jgi:hypothetical protein
MLVNSFTIFSVPKFSIARMGSCERIIIINNKLVSRFRTSSNDHIFSKVFSPYESNESKLTGKTLFIVIKLALKSSNKLNFIKIPNSNFIIVLVPSDLLLSSSKGILTN